MNNQQYSPRGFSVLPPVVKNLLIINGLVFLAQFMFLQVFKIDLVDYLGMHYFGSAKFNPAQLVTYMFLHSTSDFSHILFNMFALWMFGYMLENIWGSKRFLIYYMVTGIGAAIVHMIVMHIGMMGLQSEVAMIMSDPTPSAFFSFVNEHFPLYQNSLSEFYNTWSMNPKNPELINQASNYLNELVEIRKDIPTVGASGAVFGILLAFGMLFPNTLIYIYFLFPIKTKWFVLIYGGLELFQGIRNSAGDNVAHFAHLGGMIFGFFLILYWNRKIHRSNRWDQNI
ncbi:MAG: rhomboid family intramembrane serine protease [Lentimicrobiaceae bacterium]